MLLVAFSDTDLPHLHGGDQGRVVHQHPEVPIGYADDNEVGLAIVDYLLGRDHPAKELPPPAPLVATLSH